MTGCPCGAGSFIGSSSGYCGAHLHLADKWPPIVKATPVHAVAAPTSLEWAAALEIEDYDF